jgi:hypothetical protein
MSDALEALGAFRFCLLLGVGGNFALFEGCKFGAYREGIYGYFFTILCIIITNVLYPIKFFQDNEGEDVILGWSYGLGWGLAVFLFAGALMLILDKGEEFSLREKMPEEEEEEAAMGTKEEEYEGMAISHWKRLSTTEWLLKLTRNFIIRFNKNTKNFYQNQSQDVQLPSFMFTIHVLWP